MLRLKYAVSSEKYSTCPITYLSPSKLSPYHYSSPLWLPIVCLNDWSYDGLCLQPRDIGSERFSPNPRLNDVRRQRFCSQLGLPLNWRFSPQRRSIPPLLGILPPLSPLRRSQRALFSVGKQGRRSSPGILVVLSSDCLYWALGGFGNILLRFLVNLIQYDYTCNCKLRLNRIDLQCVMTFFCGFHWFVCVESLFPLPLSVTDDWSILVSGLT